MVREETSDADATAARPRPKARVVKVRILNCSKDEAELKSKR